MTASDPAQESFDALIRRVDPDRWLAARFVADERAREDLMVLYAYDHELARAPRVASNALLGEIRLTWWNEVLDEIFEGRAVRRHPTAQAIAELVARAGLPREPLQAMLDARYLQLDKGPLAPDIAVEWADGAGGGAMRAAALILDPDSPSQATVAAGRAFGLWRLNQTDLTAPRLANLAKASVETRALSVSAFPAVLPAALARAPGAGGIAKRLRLLWAVLTGRI